MEQKKPSVSRLVQEIKRKTRRVFSSEEKIQIVLECLRGEESIAALCRKYVSTPFFGQFKVDKSKINSSLPS